MYFPSKKDIWYRLIFWGTVLILVIPAVMQQEILGLFIGLPIAFFIGWIWFTTGYTIEDSMLKIKFGPFRKWIAIQDISKMNRVKNPISAPALSINRIEIIHGKFYDGVFLSPENEREFIQLILQENPQIILDEKLNNDL